MITDTYKKAMKVGAILVEMKAFKDDSLIPYEWTDNVELAHLVNYIKGDVTEESVKEAIATMKAENERGNAEPLEDLDWDDEVRGLIAGYNFGRPNDASLALAEKAEKEWDDDIEGKIGYYHQVCEKIAKEVA